MNQQPEKQVKTVYVHIKEIHIQKVAVEIDASLTGEAAREAAREEAGEGNFTEVGAPEYLENDGQPSDWDVANEKGELI